MITKKYLHKIEMELVNLCEDNEVMKENIINKFTDLINEAERISTTEEAIKLLKNKRGFEIEDISMYNWEVSDDEFKEKMSDEQLIEFANDQSLEVEE